jgi:SSS family solute:Na+ symporter
MISIYDYVNIAFYIVFITGVGIVFSRKSKNTSDYFRGGGVMPWWVAGASSWMASFSAWTFVGAAGEIYDEGPSLILLYYSSLIPLVCTLFYTCYRFRRMRVVTPIEGVRLRFGAASQQFYTWIRLPLLFLFGGIGLNSVGTFMSGVFGLNVILVMIILGIMVTFVALLGGSYSVVANDFVQMFLVVTVAVTVAILALAQPSIGGVSGLIAKAPHQAFHWNDIARSQFFLFFFLGLTLNNLFDMTRIDNSAKYLMAASDRHARKMLIIPLVGTLLGPLIWFVPPMTAAILHSHADMAQRFPLLAPHPEHAAFLATALDVLPQGMLGLLICGIFASTVTNLDASLNQAVGIFVRNFYLPILNPACAEKKLLIISKVCTAAFGATCITIGIIVNPLINQSSGLFQFLTQLGISLGFPLTIPLALGLFYKRTPAWSTWTTVIIGLVVSYVIGRHTDPSLLGWFGIPGPYSAQETKYYYMFATPAAVGLIAISWFFFTSLFYESSPPEYKASVEEFFTRLKEPVQKTAGQVTREDTSIATSIGKLCLIYGSFVVLSAAIPNSVGGRLCFICSGGVMVATGFFLVHFYRALDQKNRHEFEAAQLAAIAKDSPQSVSQP